MLFLLLLMAGDNAAGASPASVAAFLESHCADCHSGDDPSGGFDAEALRSDAIVDASLAEWETLRRRVAAGQMPPPEADRPHDDEAAQFLVAVDNLLDNYAAAHPRVGTVAPMRRLTRTEYRNAVRDLLALDIDAAELLPKDESSGGFDNITVTELSPTRLDRSLAAAERIASQAIGLTQTQPAGQVYRVRPDRTQERHVDGLPLGTRGGVLIEHLFARSGEYEFRVRLARDRDEKVEGLDAPHELDLLIDRARRHRFPLTPPQGASDWERDFSNADAHLHVRLPIEAGSHTVGVTFPVTQASLREIRRQPFAASYNRHRHPRQAPAVYEVSIIGPLDDATPSDGKPSDEPIAVTPSLVRIFGPLDPQAHASYGRDEATQILDRLGRLAYRRPLTDRDRDRLLAFFDAEPTFLDGLERSLAAMLASPHFLFRIERPAAAGDGPQPVAAIELASRLSFLIWSSGPDDRLLDAAEDGSLLRPETLRDEVDRMLADPRSASLTANFAAQWLQLRNLDAVNPDLRLFPDFDDNLRTAMRRETELVFDEIARNDRPITDLLSCDFTYLNERLATHYGIAGVKGSRFRRFALPPGSHRGGLLRQASVLTVTSYATRTSPTIRGNWVLETLLGTPAPPPPPNVPALDDKPAQAAATIRERLAQHRSDPACASCHDLMDPIGFALENFDAVGRWRSFEGERPIDPSGTLPDGRVVASVDDLDAAITARSDLFVHALSERLLTFALGRPLTPQDGPYVRRVVAAAHAGGDRFADLLHGVVASPLFLMRDQP